MAWNQIDSIIWGIDNAGDPSDLLKPSDPNVIKAGWPQGKPNRQYFNWILYDCHNNIGFLETNGWPTWDGSTEYDQYALVRYGTKHYISLQTANENNTPSTATAWWKDYFVWLSEQAGTEQTNQTVAAFNEGYYFEHPEYVDGDTIYLNGDNILLTDLALYPLDVNPLTITVPTLSANTWYYVYVEIPSGSDVVPGDVSIITTAPSFNPANGMYFSGTKRCIGYIEGHNTGNGDAEPFVVANGWYQRRDKKKRLALYTPAPQTNTTLYSGAPGFDGNGLVEVTMASYEAGTTGMGFAEHPDYSGSINASDLSDYTDPGYDIGFNGSNISGVSLESGISNDIAIIASGIVPVDSSSNIFVSSHSGGSVQDEMLAVWLRRFKLPKGIGK